MTTAAVTSVPDPEPAEAMTREGARIRSRIKQAMVLARVRAPRMAKLLGYKSAGSIYQRLDGPTDLTIEEAAGFAWGVGLTLEQLTSDVPLESLVDPKWICPCNPHWEQLVLPVESDFGRGVLSSPGAIAA